MDPDALPLSAAEARVLGCLIEKQATTPDVYPLTVNAAQAAANQKTAREPVLSLDAGTVHHALRQLERKGLAKQVFSSRAERYEHHAESFFGVPRAQVVLLGLLLLRGPQTLHELLARSERMYAFADVEDLRHHLERLIQRAQPLAVLVPRASGQREDRFMHLLCGDAPVDVATGTARPREVVPAETRVALEARVEVLEAELARLRQRLDALEGRAAR
ncbi:MAG: DUF480 domain-containing protein [Luteimonas sp.]|nr:DUF480 domain-containing protein [Luteimonas sp.]